VSYLRGYHGGLHALAESANIAGFPFRQRYPVGPLTHPGERKTTRKKRSERKGRKVMRRLDLLATMFTMPLALLAAKSVSASELDW
jgi:hypothetical protein